MPHSSSLNLCQSLEELDAWNLGFSLGQVLEQSSHELLKETFM